jgi:hypothetical protein
MPKRPNHSSSSSSSSDIALINDVFKDHPDTKARVLVLAENNVTSALINALPDALKPQYTQTAASQIAFAFKRDPALFSKTDVVIEGLLIGLTSTDVSHELFDASVVTRIKKLQQTNPKLAVNNAYIAAMAMAGVIKRQPELSENEAFQQIKGLHKGQLRALGSGQYTREEVIKERRAAYLDNLYSNIREGQSKAQSSIQQSQRSGQSNPHFEDANTAFNMAENIIKQHPRFAHREHISSPNGQPNLSGNNANKGGRS